MVNILSARRAQDVFIFAHICSREGVRGRRLHQAGENGVKISTRGRRMNSIMVGNWAAVTQFRFRPSQSVTNSVTIYLMGYVLPSSRQMCPSVCTDRFATTNIRIWCKVPLSPGEKESRNVKQMIDKWWLFGPTMNCRAILYTDSSQNNKNCNLFC